MSGVYPKLLVDAIFQASLDGLIAKAGGGQANATIIPAIGVVRFTTVTTAGDSAKLPAAQQGLDILVINHGVNTMQVFGQPGDTIDDVASAVGVGQMADSVTLYTCVTTGTWYTEGLATGYARGVAGQFATFSSADGLVAHAGGGQAGATPLTTMQNFFGTVVTAGDSALLPAAKVGMEVAVINKAALSMNVFPQPGEQMNGAANAAQAVVGGANGSVTIFFCGSSGAWWTK